MNKKSLRIAGWALGLSMAVAGIGATVGATQKSPIEVKAEGTWSQTALAELAAGDVFVIVGNNGSNYALSNSNGTSSAPSAIAVTISEGKIDGKVNDNIKWNISGNAKDGYVFYPNGDAEKWLYCTNTNNGIRVGTNSNKTFTIQDDYIYNTATSRYVGIYNSSDWRCYSTINSNITGQSFAFYKYSEDVTTYTVTYNPNGASDGSMDPAEAASNWLVPSPSFTRPEGKYFSYWATASDGSGTKYYPGETVDITADTDLYAIWSDPVTLTYKANGGTGSDVIETYGLGYKATVRDNEFTEPETKKFKTWNTAADKSGTPYSEGGKIDLMSNSTLYAIWDDAKEGSLANPYWADDLTAEVKASAELDDEVYVKGYVKSATYSAQYSNSNIYLTSDKDNSSTPDNDCFELYRTTAVSGVTLSSIKTGDFVIAKGSVKLYGSQAEFESGCKVVEHNNVTSVAVSGTPAKATQYSGDEFDASGLSFSAHYHLGPDEEITDGIEWDELEAGVHPHGTYNGFGFDVESVSVAENTLTVEISGTSLSDNTFDSDGSWNHEGLTASGSYANGSSLDSNLIEWSYSPATPSLMGAGDNQDLTITATASTGEFDSIVVKVNVEAVAVEITGIKALGEENPLENYSLDILRTNTEGVQLNASVYPDTALGKGLVYVSSNPSKISVSNTGLVELHDAVVGDKADITITSTGNTENGYDEVQAVVKVTVTRESQKVTIQKPAAWTKVTNASALQSGDLLVIASESKGKVMSSTISSSIAGEESATFSNGAISSELPVSAAQLTLGGSAGAWTLSNSSGEELGATAAKKIAWDSGTTTWSISIDEGNATIQNGTASYGRILHNVTSTRFTTYTSDTTSSMLLPQIYKYTGGESEMPISDDLYSAVISAEQNISCNNSGIGSTYDWDKVAEEFGKYEGNPQTFTFLDDSWVNLKYAVANESGNEVEQFLARYDYIVGKYKENDFLGRSGETVFSYGPEKTRATDLLTASDGSSSNATFFVLVAVASGLAVSAGFAFLRRKKEDR